MRDTPSPARHLPVRFRSRRSLLGLACCGAVLAQWPARLLAAERTLVLAAASLKEVLEALAQAFAGATGIRVRYAFAATSTLVRQLEQGIDAGVFISADLDWMDHAVRRGLVEPASVVELIGNRLVLVAPRGEVAPFTLRRGADLRAPLADGRLALADVRAVPAGRYAKQALDSLELWQQVAGRLAMTENVRAALALAARGEVRLAAVYETDALADPRVEVVARFPAGSHRPIRYPAALVRGHATDEASAFLRFLGTPAAAKVFRAHGFVVPG